MSTFTIEPRGPFSLAAAARFIAGWPPARGVAAGDGDERGVVRLAFRVDDWSGHAGVILRQAGDDAPVTGEIVAMTAGDEGRVRAQVARILSLDHDGTGFAAIGGRDPVVGARQREAAFLRPVLFHSPYEAACWAIVSTRLHWARAARIRSAMGLQIDVAGQRLDVFPAPDELLARTEIPGLSAEKVDRLHGIARAALDGRLDRERLLALEPDTAAAELRTLRGIGAFWADAVVLRAVGPPDALTVHEPRLRAATATAYDRPEVERDDAAFTALAEGWRPYRTWVSLLMRATGRS